MRFLHWELVLYNEEEREVFLINGFEVLCGVVLAGAIISLGYLVLAWTS